MSKPRAYEKKVDFYVYDNPSSAINSIDKDEDYGKLNVIENEDTPELNSLYLGDKHIASGYGFDDKSTKKAVVELLANPNIKQLLANTLVTDDEPEEEQEIEVVYPSSSIYVNNTEISFTGGQLHAESFINVYNIELKLNDDNILREGNVYQYDMIEDAKKIINIDFDYDVKSSNPRLYYMIDFERDGASADMTLTGEDISELNSDGKRHHCSLNVDIDLPKDTGKLIYEFPINIIFTNLETYTFIKICKVKYAYSVYVSSVENITDISTDGNDKRYALYDDLHGAEVTLPNGEQTYNYIFVPTLLTTNGFSIIYKKSSVACPFRLKAESLRYDSIKSGATSDIYYDKYCSPWQYEGEMTWIIK